MTGLELWKKFCEENEIDINTPHDTWKFCGGGPFANVYCETKSLAFLCKVFVRSCGLIN